MRGAALGLGLHEKFFESSYDESFWVMRLIGYPVQVQAPARDPVRADGAEEHDIEASQQEQEHGLGCGAHTDYGCLTLLHADKTVGCLQVRSRVGVNGTGGVHGDGNGDDCRADDDGGGEDSSWIAADPVEDALLVNIGDMLELWSGGRWTATEHRVLPPTAQGVACAAATGAAKPETGTASHYRISVPFFFEPNFDARIEPIIPTVGSEHVASVTYGRHLLSKVQSNFAHDDMAS